MRNETKEMAIRFESINWFSNCGHYEGTEYMHVPTRENALERFTSREWFGFANPIRNRAREIVVPTFATAEDYNAVALSVSHTLTDALMKRLEAIVNVKLGTEPQIKEALRMDVVWILWEVEFAPWVSPLFYTPLILPGPIGSCKCR